MIIDMTKDDDHFDDFDDFDDEAEEEKENSYSLKSDHS